MNLNELANKLNKINDENKELNEDFKNIVQNISVKDETNETRDVKYSLYKYCTNKFRIYSINIRFG